MTSRGFDALERALNTRGESGPEVYVHVGEGGALDKEVLRIGKAKYGVIDRWINQGWGHQSTFLWSTGEEKRYARYAEKYPNYLAFFASLSDIDTQLHILSCPEGSMNQSEKSLITYFYPVWESYKKTIKTYLEKNPETWQKIAKYGGAREIVKSQRSGEAPFSERMPDALDFTDQTKRKWTGY